MRIALLASTMLAAPAMAQTAQPQQVGAATDEIVIVGYRAQTEAAIEAKRVSPILLETLVSDDIGQQPDYNIADSFRRVPGVQTIFDEDEGRYVSIRGLNPSFTLGSLDGATIATAERFNRQLNLEAVPSTAVQALEVLKMRTPDVDGNAIGGTINLVTRSAFAVRGLYAVANAFIGVSDSQAVPGRGLNRPSDDGLNWRVDGTISTTFGPDNQFGILATGSYSVKRRDQERLLPQNLSALTPAQPAPALPPADMLWSNYPNSVDRYGGTLKLEWRPSDRLELDVTGTYFEQSDNELRHSLRLIRTPNQSFVRFNDFPIDKPLTIVNGRAEWRPAERQRLAARASWSEARFLEPSNQLQFAFVGVPDYDVGLPASGIPTVVGRDPRINDPGQYRFQSYEFYVDDSYDEVAEGALDYGWNNGRQDEGLGLGAGAKWRRTIRDFQRSRDLWGPAPGVDLRLTPFEQVEDYAPILSQNIRQIFLDFPAFDAFFRANPGQFVFNSRESDIRRVAGSWKMREDVGAAYLLAQHAGPRHLIVGGVRYERTDTVVNSTRRQVVGTTDIFTPQRLEADYDDWLPSVTLRFSATPEIILRAGYYEAVGRPNPSQLAGGDTVQQDGSISRANPELRARYGRSYDLAIEYYLPTASGGLLSGAVFHKDVDNEIFSSATQELVDGQLVTVNQPRNAAGASVTGVEANLILPRLGALPGPLANLGFQANATVLDGRATLVGTNIQRRLTSLTGQANFLMNAAIFYEAGGIRARASYAYVDRYLSSVNIANPALDRTEGAYHQLDGQVRYAFSPRLEVIGEVRNITNERRLNFTGPARPEQGVGRQNIGRDINQFGRQFWIGAAFRL